MFSSYDFVYVIMQLLWTMKVEAHVILLCYYLMLEYQLSYADRMFLFSQICYDIPNQT
jgi:hypothetical protein